MRRFRKKRKSKRDFVDPGTCARCRTSLMPDAGTRRIRLGDGYYIMSGEDAAMPSASPTTCDVAAVPRK